MIIDTTIELVYDKNIFKLFDKKDYSFLHKNVKAHIITRKDKIIIKLSSSDITAMRTVFNAVTKNLTVYDNMKKVVENDTN